MIYSYFTIQIVQAKADQVPDLRDVAHVAWQEPYNLHDLVSLSWVGSVLLQISPKLSQALTTAGQDIDDLDDLDDLSV